jgi:hypothetical protein
VQGAYLPSDGRRHSWMRALIGWPLGGAAWPHPPGGAAIGPRTGLQPPLPGSTGADARYVVGIFLWVKNI